MIRRIAAVALALGLVIGWSSVASAQNAPRAAPTGTAIKVDGKVNSVVPGQGLLVDGTDGKKYAVGFNPQSKVTMAGNATPDILRPGMFVQFTVNLDAEGKPMGEATKLQLTDQSAINQPGISSEKGPDAKPGEPGPYFVRGTVRSYREGSLVVSAGARSITVAVSETAPIPVTVSDWTLASAGDSITGDGKAFQANPQFTPVLGERIDIKAVMPISGKKKR